MKIEITHWKSSKIVFDGKKSHYGELKSHQIEQHVTLTTLQHNAIKALACTDQKEVPPLSGFNC